MSKTNVGNDLQALQMGGGGAGYAGTAGTPTGTTLPISSGTPWTANQWVGHYVVSGSVYGVVVSNTTSTLTIDRWTNPASPGGSAGTTPSAGAAFIILPGGAPAYFMCLGTSNTSPTAGDTSMSDEYNHTGGGLNRYPAVYTHTTSAASYTLTGTFVANSSDTFPTTAYRIGLLTSLTGGILQFETMLSSAASFNASGDQATITLNVSN